MKTNIYACGGAGANIAKRLVLSSHQLDLLAEPDVFYIDTSDSNLGNLVQDPNVFVIPGADGSGKIRGANNAAIETLTRQMLQKFSPATFNIVVTSASGGSGSVIAYHLVNHLLSSGKSVVLFIIGSVGSAIEIDNAAKTIASFDALAKSAKKPVVIHYQENSATLRRQQVDEIVVGGIQALLALFKGHYELDSADVLNFLSGSHIPKAAVGIQFFQGDEQYAQSDVAHVASVASLRLEKDDIYLEPLPPYHAVGVASDAYRQEGIVTEGCAAHYAINTSVIANAMALLKPKRQQALSAARAVLDVAPIKLDEEDSSPGGIIL